MHANDNIRPVHSQYVQHLRGLIILAGWKMNEKKNSRQIAVLKEAVEFAESHAERLEMVIDQNTTWDEHIGLESGQGKPAAVKPAANDDRRPKL